MNDFLGEFEILDQMPVETTDFWLRLAKGSFLVALFKVLETKFQSSV